jgi:hypothetical protein
MKKGRNRENKKEIERQEKDRENRKEIEVQTFEI